MGVNVVVACIAHMNAVFLIRYIEVGQAVSILQGELCLLLCQLCQGIALNSQILLLLGKGIRIQERVEFSNYLPELKEQHNTISCNYFSHVIYIFLKETLKLLKISSSLSQSLVIASRSHGFASPAS